MITVAELDERIERCLAILADNPHSQVFAALAEAYRRRGEFGRAFAVCKSGLKHHPNYAPAHVVMAKLYLHQKMLNEAMNSLKRAIEIDGSTRQTDLLEAELHLEMGDLSSAHTVVERLRRSERRNPAVVELVRRLKALRKQEAEKDDPVASEQGISTAPETSQPAHDHEMPETLTWDEWGARLRLLHGVTSVFAWDESARVIFPVDAATTGDSDVSAVLETFREIEAHLNGADCGPLRGLRVETDDGELWCGRIDSMIIGCIGTQKMSYGEVRRLATDWYALVQRDESEPDAPAAESQEQ